MNPILFRQGVCDPHIHIFNGKAYLYATKDNPGFTTGFNMTEWQVWSSTDLINWSLESRMFPEDFYCGKIDQCWATDAAEKNGKYYWYYSRGAEETGVGVSDHPGGPFRDALGAALVCADTPPKNVPKWDPCCFVDDDGSAYLIVGYTRLPPPNNKYLIAKLNDDMISLAEDLRQIECEEDPCGGDDKASIHKANGRYYLSHASYYAVSDHLYGPYQHRGNFAANNDHGSFFSYLGQDYNASGGMDNPNRFYRASFLHYVHYKDNGDIVIDKQIGQYGVGQYDACWDNIEAEWFFAADGIQKKEKAEGGFEIREIHNGDSLFYQNVNNVEENTRITVRASCHNPNGGTIVITNGKDGEQLGSIRVTDTGGWDCYQDFSTRLSNPCGTIQLYFTFLGGPEELLRLDSFRFGEPDTYRQCSEGYMGVKTGKVQSKKEQGANGSLCTGGFCQEGDSLSLCVDGAAGAELHIQYFNYSDTSASLALSVNGEGAGFVTFEPSAGAKKSLVLHPALKSGINVITLSYAEHSAEGVYIDNLITRRKRDIFRSYAMGNADFFPRGNGCWDNLPQTETDLCAYSGRMLNALIRDGSGATLSGVMGDGSEVTLVFRYSSSCDSEFELLVNGLPGGHLQFKATGSDCMDKAQTASITLTLAQGPNQITLLKTGENGKLSLDALTVTAP